MQITDVTMSTKQKVLVYLTWRRKLLAFRQPQFPRAGLQVIAGSIEKDESPDVAAMREIVEESGIESATLRQKLGEFHYSMRKFGRNEIQHRYVYHAIVPDTVELPDTWAHFERHPTSGGAPIEFVFSWHEIAEAKEVLIAGQGYLLSVLHHVLTEWR